MLSGFSLLPVPHGQNSQSNIEGREKGQYSRRYTIDLLPRLYPKKINIRLLLVAKFNCRNSLVTRWKEYNLQGRSIIFSTKGVDKSEN